MTPPIPPAPLTHPTLPASPTPPAESGGVQFSAPNPPPLTLYIHLPWCVRKCPYCDFNSHRAPKVLPEKEYADAIVADAEKVVPQVWGRRISAVFLGGGTPSLFSPDTLDSLLSRLRAVFTFAPDAEITMEANPGASDLARFPDFRAAGINRLSLGAQSFNDEALVRLGRVHDGQQARAAAARAAEVFGNFNIDLMFALPGADSRAALEDLQTAMSFSPPHLSLYQLTLEPGTPFFRAPPANLPGADLAADISDALTRTAEAAGWKRYEISAYARAGMECRHNMNYWLFGDYVGLGAGAHAKLTTRGEIRREARVKNPTDYVRRARAGDAVGESRVVRGRDAVFELMLNGMRLTAGIPSSLVLERAGTVVGMESALREAEARELIERDAFRIRPTARGLRFLNDLLELFLPEKESGEAALARQ